MPYSNIPFLFYFLPVSLVGYLLLCAFRQRAVRHTFLLLCSLVFLFMLHPLFVPLAAVLSLVNYGLALRIKKALWEGQSPQRLLRAAFVVGGGVFAVFQLSFLLFSFNLGLPWLDGILYRTMILPAGIAILVLRGIGYVADVSNRRVDADKNLLHLTLYLCFFPQIIIGPLSSYGDFKAQLSAKYNVSLLYEGTCRFVIGLGKKILIAGSLAVITDTAFSLSVTSDSLTRIPVTLAWLGAAVFLLQVYYDFSAYSDIAIGLSGMFGFTAPENFRYPYAARSMEDFWTRWMITIHQWFDRHVSMPLNRQSARNSDQMAMNMLLAFIVMGLWQKASIGMLVWALLQVICIAMERVITYDERSIPSPVRHGYVLIVLMFSAVLMRYDSAYHTLLYLRNMTGLNGNGFLSPLALSFLKESWMVIAAAVLFALPVAPWLRARVDAGGKGVRAAAAVVYPLLLTAVVALCILFIARGLYVPGVYANF